MEPLTYTTSSSLSLSPLHVMLLTKHMMISVPNLQSQTVIQRPVSLIFKKTTVVRSNQRKIAKDFSNVFKKIEKKEF